MRSSSPRSVIKALSSSRMSSDRAERTVESLWWGVGDAAPMMAWMHEMLSSDPDLRSGRPSCLLSRKTSVGSAGRTCICCQARAGASAFERRPGTHWGESRGGSTVPLWRSFFFPLFLFLTLRKRNRAPVRTRKGYAASVRRRSRQRLRKRAHPPSHPWAERTSQRRPVRQGKTAPHSSRNRGRSSRIHRNFLLSATASSSQRLLLAFSAWPFTQWRWTV